MDIASLVEIKRNPKIPDIAPGDTVRVSSKIVEGGKERIQVFQGVIIKMRRGSTGASFTVRHVAYGIGVERTFLLYSPLVEKVEIVRHGKVRRAKLYYLRGLSGRAARRKIKRVDRKAKKVGEEVLEPQPEEIVEPLLETEEAAVLEEEQAREEVVEESPVSEEEQAAESALEPEPVQEALVSEEKLESEPVLKKKPGVEAVLEEKAEKEQEPIVAPEAVREQEQVQKEPASEKEQEGEPVLEQEAEAVLEPEEDKNPENEKSPS